MLLRYEVTILFSGEWTSKKESQVSMLSSKYRFPLFDDLLYGALSPFSSSNSCEAFLLEEEPHLRVEMEADAGIYALTYPKPLNLKCSFYYNRLPGETVSYCNDLREHFTTLTDPDIRAYLKLTILDRHLKTALIKTGELLREYKLSTADFLAPAPGADIEKISNSYIFHLLKICLAKAYLEVQSILEPRPAKQVDETYLYTALTGEIPPVKIWLRKRKFNKPGNLPSPPKQAKKKTELAPEEKSPTVTEKTYTLSEISEMGYGSERTLRRRLADKEINGFKNGSKWLVEKIELDRYIAYLKAKTKTHNK